MLEGKVIQTDLHDEKTNKKLLAKDQVITRDVLEKMKTFARPQAPQSFPPRTRA